MMSKLLKGRSLSKGIVEGEAIVTKQPFSISIAFLFPLLTGSKSLKVADRTHELYKKDVKNKVLVIPFAIGTTTLGFVLLETIVRGMSPKAIVCEKGEPLLSSGALCADIFFNKQFPIVDQIEIDKIPNGATVRVNGTNGTVEVL